MAKDNDVGPTRSDVYQALVARRLSWDTLTWQVPVISFTAQAFLFTISLGADSTYLARVAAALFALVVATLSMTLMKANREAETADSELLARLEAAAPVEQPLVVHGLAIRELREDSRTDAGSWDKLVPKWRAYKSWIIGLQIFWLGSLAILVVVSFFPGLIGGSPPPWVLPAHVK